MKEFGYPVSMDYEKLWELVEHRYLNGDNLPIFGFAYDFSDYPNRKQVFIESNNAVEIHGIDFGCYILISRSEKVVDHNKAKSGFITTCKDLKLTFIDPEPTEIDINWTDDNFESLLNSVQSELLHKIGELVPYEMMMDTDKRMFWALLWKIHTIGYESGLMENTTNKDPNAIYYADGTKVENGDYIDIPNGHLSGHSRRRIVMERWCVCILIYEGTDHEKHTPVRYCSCIEWDGNRMTNVSKVEE